MRTVTKKIRLTDEQIKQAIVLYCRAHLSDFPGWTDVVVLTHKHSATVRMSGEIGEKEIVPDGWRVV